MRWAWAALLVAITGLAWPASADASDAEKAAANDDAEAVARASALLERVKRDPVLASDPDTIALLARDADSSPPGVVRVEARMLVAQAWLGRLHRPDAAIPELRAVADGPECRLAHCESCGASAHRRPRIARRHRRGRGRGPRSHGDAGTAVRARILQLIRRRTLRFAALSIIAFFAVLSIMAVVRAQRRGRLAACKRELYSFALVAALFVAFVALGGGLLASSYESGNSSPFLVLGAAILPLVLLARAWSTVGSTARAARAGRAILCGATVVSSAFLVLDLAHPEYLSGFGL